MSTLRHLTAGESHGAGLTAIVEGCPAGVALDAAAIDADLARRQLGFGRGGRQRIEQDRVAILSGVRHGRTTGAPIALGVANRDAPQWVATMAVEPVDDPGAPVRIPRPGHADLAGSTLYGLDDLRDVIERASARETAARVACGAVARRLLSLAGCTVGSHVVAVGEIEAGVEATPAGLERVDADPLRCLDTAASAAMRDAVVKAGEAGDSLGGVFEVIAYGFPPGVGSYAQADRRLGTRLAAAVFGIPAIKGVEIGLGFEAARRPGSRVHDEILWSEADGYGRSGNNAGGIEGGISTGLPIVVRAAMKPIATLTSPLASVRLGTHETVAAHVERSDVCAVPAAAVVGEAVVALCLAAALLERCGAETADELVAGAATLRERARRP